MEDNKLPTLDELNGATKTELPTLDQLNGDKKKYTQSIREWWKRNWNKTLGFRSPFYWKD